MDSQALRSALWMLVGAVSFATMGSFTHALGSRCDWLVVALVRALFMLGSAVVLARSAGVRLVVFRPPTLWIRSVAGSVSLVCNFYAISVLPVADALTLTSMYPLWIVIISAAWLRRIPSGLELGGMASGLIGVALIQRPHLDGAGLAAAVAVSSSATTAAALMGLHRLRHVDTRAVVAHFAGVGSLMAGLWLAIRSIGAGAPVVETDPTTLGLLLGVALSGTIGQMCLTRAYALGVPTRVAVIGLSQVAFGMIADVWIWGRVLTPLTLLGFALVLSPTALLTAIARRRLADVALPDPEAGADHVPDPTGPPCHAPRPAAAHAIGD
ncbi:DMT family transporter [Tautonia plasticadhaerens]|uniref:EamA-like transporter family protein n=1 Tax=Tautonia plasticadhaerens TaxID=2527974 RepID=A0A518H5L7_9BACT|nr:DMT family transporter [Tautonia plasticadhaerens]QDV36137.1 EamA-like transporter family protein [Tautonia plasticadhaerens]